MYSYNVKEYCNHIISTSLSFFSTISFVTIIKPKRVTLKICKFISDESNKSFKGNTLILNDKVQLVTLRRHPIFLPEVTHFVVARSKQLCKGIDHKRCFVSQLRFLLFGDCQIRTNWELCIFRHMSILILGIIMYNKLIISY